MIRPLPTNDAGRVLSELVRLGTATPRELGARLWPYLGRRPQFGDATTPEHLRQLVASYEAARAAWLDDATKRASSALGVLGRLRRDKAHPEPYRLITERGRPEVAAWVLRGLWGRYGEASARLEADPLALAACRALGVPPDAHATPEPAALARVMLDVASSPTLRTSAQTSGWQATLARGIRLGLIVSGAERAATAEGRELDASWGA